MNISKYIYIFLSISVLFSLPTQVLAHGAFVRAWVEGGQVCTQSSYTKKHAVPEPAIQVTNNAGTILLQGKGDVHGKWCFTPLERQDMIVIMTDGQGHRATAKLAAATLPLQHTVSSANGTVVRKPDTVHVHDALAAVADTASVTPAVAVPADALSPVMAAAIRTIVREEMHAQLAPLHEAVAGADKETVHGPTVKDIAGGIGWIVGLGGIIAYLSGRRKQQ